MIVFGAWDIISENAAQVAERSDVLRKEHQALVRPAMEKIVPKKGVHNPEFVRRSPPTT